MKIHTTLPIGVPSQPVVPEHIHNLTIEIVQMAVVRPSAMHCGGQEVIHAPDRSREDSVGPSLIVIEHGDHEMNACAYEFGDRTLLNYAKTAAEMRATCPDVPVYSWGMPRPHYGYPAYKNIDGAMLRFEHAAHLMDIAAMDGLLVNCHLNLGGDSNHLPAQEIYARTVQIINWSRAALPTMHIIPSFDLDARPNQATALGQAVSDCACSEVCIWEDFSQFGAFLEGLTPEKPRSLA